METRQPPHHLQKAHSAVKVSTEPAAVPAEGATLGAPQGSFMLPVNTVRGPSQGETRKEKLPICR